MKILILSFIILSFIGCTKENINDLKKETLKELTIEHFQNIKEIDFYCYSVKERKYISFTINDPKEIKSMTTDFDLIETEGCMCKKSSYATFKKDDKTEVKIEFGQHSFSSKEHRKLYKTDPNFWNLFLEKIK